MAKNILKVGLSIGVSFAILALLLKMLSADLPDDLRPSVIGALQSTDLRLVGIFIVIAGICLLALKPSSKDAMA